MTHEKSTVREEAERRFVEAMERSGARDPRDFYRGRLKALREKDADAYRRAVAHHETSLIPAIASGEADPVQAWLEFGRLLATLFADGETVQIDPSGRSTPYAQPVPGDRLVLHLPLSSREPAIPVGLPPTLSPEQRATYDLLVSLKTG